MMGRKPTMGITGILKRLYLMSVARQRVGKVIGFVSVKIDEDESTASIQFGTLMMINAIVDHVTLGGIVTRDAYGTMTATSWVDIDRLQWGDSVERAFETEARDPECAPIRPALTAEEIAEIEARLVAGDDP